MTPAGLSYHDPVFRPPSEANSLILQVTLGCSWNRCSFCDMYTSKRFQTRPIEAIRADLELAAQSRAPIKRIFLADGDAMVLSTRRLLEILALIGQHLPAVRRISSWRRCMRLMMPFGRQSPWRQI